jgi:hypothetical protein
MGSKVYVCGTLYHVFISTLKSIKDKHEGNESLLIVNDHTPNLTSIAQNLVNEGFFTYSLFIPFVEIDKLRSKTGFFRKNITRNKFVIESVENNSNIKSQHDFIKKSEINLFYNLGLSSVYFLVRFKKNNFNQIEDGFRNYNPLVNNFKAFKRKYILNTPQGEGRDFQIKSIEVQYPEKLPEVVKYKGVKLDLAGLVQILTNENRQKILNIFAQDNVFRFDGHNKVILITQPLSEDGFITEEYKINLYKQILKDYASGFDIYIKAHPRETTVYKDKFDFEISEIPRNFPLEILNLFPDITFEKGITIFSGALNNIVNIKERINLGRDYDKKLLVKKRVF